jgi:hypothetical protein
VFARLVAACAVALTLAATLAEPGAAMPLSGAQAGPLATMQSAGEASIVHKAHGFHCRRVLGWDPVAGVYRYHRHEGICRNYRGCLREHKRCIFLLGRGFQHWSIEIFASDNDRYFACMIRSGCY